MNERDRLAVAPRAEFADQLERELLRRLEQATPGDGAVRDRAVAPGRDAPLSLPTGTMHPRPAARWAARLVAAAAVAAAVIAVAVIVDRRDSPQLPPSIEGNPEDTRTPVDVTPSSAATSAAVPVPQTIPVTSTIAVTPSNANTTSAVTATTIARPPHPPFGEMPAGTYSIDNFVVPFVITTEASWIRAANLEKAFTLGRFGGVQLAVTWGVFPGDTPLAAIGNVCPGSVAFDAAPVITRLLGAEAIQLDGTFTDACTITINSQLSSDGQPGASLRVVAATVEGHVVVLLAGAPEGAWDAVAPEIDALVASMQLRTG